MIKVFENGKWKIVAENNEVVKNDLDQSLITAKTYTDEQLNIHKENKENPHSVTKTQVGLSNLTNDKQATKVDFDIHTKKIASSTELGHVKIGDGLEVDKSGSLRVKGVKSATKKTYTVIIDENNSNPETALTYADDAVNLQPQSDEFLTFLGHKPCLFKDGKVVGYLKPNDFTQFENGSPADITSGNAGDVMIEFPKRGIKIERKGTNLHVSMTDELDNPAFSYMAHTRSTTQKDKIYIGAYKAFVTGGKMRSLSGKSPTANKTIGAFRTDAQANGAGYEQSQWYQLVYRQVAYILYTRNLDSQTAIGRGYVDGNSSSNTTGSTDKLGMNYGETTGKKSMKLFGIEDFWGSINEWIDGLATSDDRDILITKDNSDYNDAGNGYQQYGKCFSKNGYLDKPVGDNNNGFIPETNDGSSSTYYADNTYQSSSGGRVLQFGGNWNASSSAGAFCVGANNATSFSSSIVSARLSYTPN